MRYGRIFVTDELAGGVGGSHRDILRNHLKHWKE